MAADIFRPALNRVAEPVGEEIFRKYQAHRQPDQQSNDKFAHNRSAATTRHTGRRTYPDPATGPRQRGKIMV
jgi:hypothetical protein